MAIQEAMYRCVFNGQEFTAHTAQEMAIKLRRVGLPVEVRSCGARGNPHPYDVVAIGVVGMGGKRWTTVSSREEGIEPIDFGLRDYGAEQKHISSSHASMDQRGRITAHTDPRTLPPVVACGRGFGKTLLAWEAITGLSREVLQGGELSVGYACTHRPDIRCSHCPPVLDEETKARLLREMNNAPIEVVREHRSIHDLAAELVRKLEPIFEEAANALRAWWAEWMTKLDHELAQGEDLDVLAFPLHRHTGETDASLRDRCIERVGRRTTSPEGTRVAKQINEAIDEAFDVPAIGEAVLVRPVTMPGEQLATPGKKNEVCLPGRVEQIDRERGLVAVHFAMLEATVWQKREHVHRRQPTAFDGIDRSVGPRRLTAHDMNRRSEAAASGVQVAAATTPGIEAGSDPGVRPVEPSSPSATTPAAAPAEPDAFQGAPHGHSHADENVVSVRAELAREELQHAGVDVSRWSTGDLVAHYDREIRPRCVPKRVRCQDVKITITLTQPDGGKVAEDITGAIKADLVRAFGGKAGA